MENSSKLFELALQLERPWYIKKVNFTPTSKKKSGQLAIYLDFEKGAKFKDDSGATCSVHDTVEKTLFGACKPVYVVQILRPVNTDTHKKVIP